MLNVSFHVILFRLFSVETNTKTAKRISSESRKRVKSPINLKVLKPTKVSPPVEKTQSPGRTARVPDQNKTPTPRRSPRVAQGDQSDDECDNLTWSFHSVLLLQLLDLNLFIVLFCRFEFSAKSPESDEPVMKKRKLGFDGEEGHPSSDVSSNGVETKSPGPFVARNGVVKVYPIFRKDNWKK